MITLLRTTAIIAAGAGMLLVATESGEAAKVCVMAGGQGTGVGEQIAKNMADIALKQKLDQGGWKPEGKSSYKCDTNSIITTCTVSQKACVNK